MSDQKTKWHDTRKARMDDLFTGRKFRIVEEFKSDEPVATPLGYKVKSGYRVEATDGKDGLQDFVIGKSLVKILADDYAAIERPAAKKRGRPRKKPLEQAEEWAARDIPDDAGPITQPGPTLVNPNQDEHL
jgi:hypothetical protein